MIDQLVILISVVVVAGLAWDFGRRWLLRQDYRIALDALSKKHENDVGALQRDIEVNKVRGDKAISNLTLQVQETVKELEKKQNAILSGSMIGRPGRRLPLTG